MAGSIIPDMACHEHGAIAMRLSTKTKETLTREDESRREGIYEAWLLVMVLI